MGRNTAQDPYNADQGGNIVPTVAWSGTGGTSAGYTLDPTQHTLSITGGGALVTTASANSVPMVEIEAALFAMISDSTSSNTTYGLKSSTSYANTGFNAGTLTVTQSYGTHALAGSLTADLNAGSSGGLNSGAAVTYAANLPNTANAFQTYVSGGTVNHYGNPWNYNKWTTLPSSVGNYPYAVNAGGGYDINPTGSASTTNTNYLFANAGAAWSWSTGQSFKKTSAAFAYDNGLDVTLAGTSYDGVALDTSTYAQVYLGEVFFDIPASTLSGTANKTVSLKVTPIQTIGGEQNTYWMESGSCFEWGVSGGTAVASTPLTVNYIAPALGNSATYSLSSTAATARILTGAASSVAFAASNTGSLAATSLGVSGADTNGSLFAPAYTLASLAVGGTASSSLAFTAGSTLGVSTYTLTGTGSNVSPNATSSGTVDIVAARSLRTGPWRCPPCSPMAATR